MLAADIKCLTRVVEVPKQRRRGNNDAMPGRGRKPPDFAEKSGAPRPRRSAISGAHNHSADRGVRGDLGVLGRVR